MEYHTTLRFKSEKQALKYLEAICAFRNGNNDGSELLKVIKRATKVVANRTGYAFGSSTCENSYERNLTKS